MLHPLFVRDRLHVSVAHVAESTSRIRRSRTPGPAESRPDADRCARPFVKLTSSRNCVISSQPACRSEGVMNFVQMSRSLNSFLFIKKGVLSP